MASILVDNFENWDSSIPLCSDYPMVGESITGKGLILNSFSFYAQKIGSATGNAYCKIYNYSGTHGADAVPSGTAIATSDAVDVSTILGTGTYYIPFTFSGANKIRLADGTHYIVTAEYSGGSVSSTTWVAMGYSALDATYDGNMVYKYASTTYADSASDLDFRFYCDEENPSVSTTGYDKVTSRSVKVTAEVSNKGSNALVSKGFCYAIGTSGDPTTSDSIIEEVTDSNIGEYSMNLITLSNGTNYRIRPFATNPYGTGYGTTMQITTLTPIAVVGQSYSMPAFVIE